LPTERAAWQKVETELQRFPECVLPVGMAAGLIGAAFWGGRKLLLCGNGGSAADCQHVAAEFVSGLFRDKPRRALAAIALTTDTSVITAQANDVGFDKIFARQVYALGHAYDVLLAISTSGHSENVIQAADAAKNQGMWVIALTGPDGGQLALVADVVIHAPGGSVQRIQESMLYLEHLICECVEMLLFPETEA